MLNFSKKTLPSIFSSGVTQINILIGTIIASFQSGAVSYLYYADRVYQLNLAIAGIAVGTVSLPVLSKLIKNKKKNEANNVQNKSIELSFLLSLPAGAALIIGSEEIVNSLFGYGSFSENDIKMTALALKYFGYGIPAFSALKIFANFFFARDNTIIPFKISSLIVFVNLIMSISFFKSLGFIIIPIATSISTWIGVILYLIILKKINFLTIKKTLYNNFAKIMLSTLIAIYSFYWCLSYFAQNLVYSSKFKILYLLFIVIFVALLYFSTCYLFKVLNLRKFRVRYMKKELVFSKCSTNW